MRKTASTFFIAIIFSLFGVQCAFLEKELEVVLHEDSPQSIDFDLDKIQERGFIRAIVDNAPTSYYVYKGRRMGYEFEMLRNLASSLGVRLHLIVSSDLDDAFQMLDKGKADIIAMNLQITPENKQKVAFTSPMGQMGTVLVQRKDNARVNSLKDLDNRIIHISKDAIYKSQLCNLQSNNEIALAIIEETGDSDQFVQRVVKKEIDFTVVNRVVGLVKASQNKELDVSLEVSPKSDVAWAVRTNSPELKSTIDSWLEKRTKSGYLRVLNEKYFKNSTNRYFRNTSPYSSLAGNNISPYDDIIKKGADHLGWDWRLLASLVYKESGFDTTATSYAGATGLLQLMPVTLERYGVENPSDPLESLMGGVNYLKYLDKFWRKRITDANERIKFVLASYNVGHGHVEDAWRLTIRYGGNPNEWGDVSHYMKLKSDPEFYQDAVVKNGFAKGHVPVNYVEDILILYDSYRVLIEP